MDLFAEYIMTKINKKYAVDIRTTNLGHIQRGGAPCAEDRLIAAQFGAHAVELIANNQSNKIVAIRNGKLGSIDFNDSAGKDKHIEPDNAVLKTAIALDIYVGKAN